MKFEFTYRWLQPADQDTARSRALARN